MAHRLAAARTRISDPAWLRVRLRKISRRPSAKMIVRRPPTMRLELNIIAALPRTPRSLRAFSVQLNQGE